MAGFDPRVFYNSSGQPYEDGAFYDGFTYPGPNNGPWRVEIAFDLAANGVGDWFTLDDPVKGVLDNSTYLLSGDLLVDLTRWVRSISVRRGRSRTLERYVTGQCEIIFDNTDRLFDPLMTGGPFYGQLVPGKQVRISYDDYPVFTGNTSDWNYDYALPRDATATVQGLDGFAVFAAQFVPEQTMTQQLVGARIEKVLDDIGWPSEQRSIDTGTASVGADLITPDTNALSYMQKVEQSQFGLLFMSKDGLVRFEDSSAGVETGYIIGETGIPFIDFEVVYGVEELYNKINVEYLQSGSPGFVVTAQSASSQSAFGVFETTISTLLAGSVAASDLAVSLIAGYKEPTYRVKSVSFNFKGVSSAAQAQLMDIELGDRATLFFTPSSKGEQIQRAVLIDTIEHQVTPSTHIITMALTDLGAGIVGT